ncbi:unnamed protein product, partial [Polarella glacialis]
VVLRRGVESSSLEVLFVSRRKAPDCLTVPAGKFEHDLDGGSFEACALRETNEEAGVECEIIFDLGWYLGAAKDHCETRTRFFVMLFKSEMTVWQESERRRHWLPLEEAPATVAWNSVLTQVFHKLEMALAVRAAAGDPLDPELALSVPAPLGGNTLRHSDSKLSMSSDDSMGLAETETEDAKEIEAKEAWKSARQVSWERPPSELSDPSVEKAGASPPVERVLSRK